MGLSLTLSLDLGSAALRTGAGATVRRLLGQGGTFGDNQSANKSDGTVNTFNTDQLFSTAVPIVNPAPAFSGFVQGAGSESNVDNVVQYHLVLYLNGGGTIDFTGGLFDVASGATLATPTQKNGVTIPAGNHRVRVFGKVPNGGFFYYTSHFRSGSLVTGYGVTEVGVDLADKSTGGTITSQSIYMPMTLLGFMGDAPAGHRVIAVAGDSNSDGVGYGPSAKGVGSGVLASHLEAFNASYFQIGRSGAGPAVMRNTYAKRIAFMAAAGVTDWWCHAATNDYYASNVNAAQEKIAIQALVSAVKSGVSGVRTWFATVPPIAIITPNNNPATVSNQTRRSFDTDDRRLVVNDWLRAGITDLNGYTEHALSVQRSDDPYKWTDDSSRDGLHFWKTGVSTSGGEAVLAALAAANPLGLS